MGEFCRIYLRLRVIILQRAEFLVKDFSVHAVALQISQELVISQPLTPAPILRQPDNTTHSPHLLQSVRVKK